MKRVGIIATIALISACGSGFHPYPVFFHSHYTGPQGPPGAPCTVVSQPEGSEIKCPDGTKAFVPNGISGSNGQDGTSGTNGLNGADGANGQDGATGPQGTQGVQGATGPQGPQGNPGQDGVNGTNGTNGTNGQDGTSCTIAVATPGGSAPNGGAIITCGAFSVLILNGAPGVQGPQGQPGTPAAPSQMSITKKINPCLATNPGHEVFLCLGDGSLIWSLSDNANGQNTRLSEAYDGSFQTTDGAHCSVTVSSIPGGKAVTWSGGGETCVSN